MNRRFKFPTLARFGLFVALAFLLTSGNAGTAIASSTPVSYVADERVQAVERNGWTMRCALSPSMLGMVRTDNGKQTKQMVASPQACDGKAPYQVLAITPPQGLTFSGNLKTGFGEAHLNGETFPSYCTSTPGNVIVYFTKGGKLAPLEFSVPNICQAGKA